MSKTKDILKQTDHRPWPMPAKRWSYYQEWNNAVFLHWKVDPKDLAGLVPKNIDLDLIDGKAWISLVAFDMEKIRPSRFPAMRFISNFHEINVRTYMSIGNKTGVYFLNIEAGKLLSAKASKLMSGLPYEKTKTSRTNSATGQKYTSINLKKKFELEVEYTIGEKINQKTELDKWLTERYCLYLDRKDKNYRYEIHHGEWELYNINIVSLKSAYHFKTFSLDRPPDLAHYSPGVKVIAWKKEKL